MVVYSDGSAGKLERQAGKAGRLQGGVQEGVRSSRHGWFACGGGPERNTRGSGCTQWHGCGTLQKVTILTILPSGVMGRVASTAVVWCAALLACVGNHGLLHLAAGLECEVGGNDLESEICYVSAVVFPVLSHCLWWFAPVLCKAAHGVLTGESMVRAVGRVASDGVNVPVTLCLRRLTGDSTAVW